MGKGNICRSILGTESYEEVEQVKLFGRLLLEIFEPSTFHQRPQKVLLRHTGKWSKGAVSFIHSTNLKTIEELLTV